MGARTGISLKPARLRKRADFLRVAGARRKAVLPGVIVQAAPRPASENLPLRLGFTASKKVGGAVARNRARRRLKAAAAAIMPAKADPDFDYVLIARPETVTRPYADLLSDLDQALRKLRR